MTESAGAVVCLAAADHDPCGPRAGLLRSVGLPLPWHEVRVVDPVGGQESGPDEVGETWVRSGQNMADDRIKDMILSGGENIYPAEVENALAGHPASPIWP